MTAAITRMSTNPARVIKYSHVKSIEILGKEFQDATTVRGIGTPRGPALQLQDYFMYDCSSLTSIDLSPIMAATATPNCSNNSHSSEEIRIDNILEVGDYFMGNCRSLLTIDLSFVQNHHDIKKLGKGFMFGCASLTSIELSPLCNITEIGEHFLFEAAIRSIDVTPLEKHYRNTTVFF